MIHLLRNVFLSVLLTLQLVPMAVGEEVAPVYQRDRGFPQAGSNWGFPGGYPFGIGYGFGFPPQVYGGSWYQRPYPYHLDYFRWRYSTPPVEVNAAPCVVDEVP